MSQRLRRFGKQVLVGDMVVPQDKKLFRVVRGEDAEGDEQEVSSGYKVCEIGCIGFKKQVHYIEVTAENKDKYTIADVIMPIIGSQVQMPKNKELQEIYDAIMAKDNVSV